MREANQTGGAGRTLSPDALRNVLLEPFGFGAPDVAITPEQWPSIVGAASEHRVLGSLWRGTALETQQPPAEVVEPIRAEYYASLTRHLKYIGLLRQLVERFGEAGVRWAVVKGPILAELAYPAVDLRSYSDLDLLVHPSDLERAVVTLEKLGGAVFERNWSFMAERQRGELQVNLPGGLFADVHWHLLISPRLRRQVHLDTIELLRRARPVSLSGLNVPALDPIDAVIHLIVHAVLAGAHRLRWSLDVEFASRRLLEDHAPGRAWAQRMTATRTGVFADVMAARVRRLLGPEAAKGWPALEQRSRWTAAVARLDEARKPEEWFGRTGSSRLLLASTRPGQLASAQAIGAAVGTAAREFVSNPAHGWRRHPAEDAAAKLPEILHDDADPHGRARFFTMARTARLR